MKLFHVFIPAHEYWVYSVEAETEEEAIDLVNNSSPRAHQIYSIACSKDAKAYVEERKGEYAKKKSKKESC